jgi:hypothetical protein
MSAAQHPLGFIVSLTTEHFWFEAHGMTEEAANEALGAALTRHGEAMAIPPNWWEDYAESFETRAFIPGSATRDGSPV